MMYYIPLSGDLHITTPIVIHKRLYHYNAGSITTSIENLSPAPTHTHFGVYLTGLSHSYLP